MARTFFQWQYLQLLTLAVIHEHFDFGVSLDLFFNRVNHYFMWHSLALYRRVWLTTTKIISGIHNCISLDVSRTRDWLFTLIANNALYIVNIYSVFFSLSCFVMYNCKYLQRQFFLARKVLIPCKYETVFSLLVVHACLQSLYLKNKGVGECFYYELDKLRL